MPVDGMEIRFFRDSKWQSLSRREVDDFLGKLSTAGSGDLLSFTEEFAFINQDNEISDLRIRKCCGKLMEFMYMLLIHSFQSGCAQKTVTNAEEFDQVVITFEFEVYGLCLFGMVGIN